MDYEKKYKDALERARQFSEHPLQEDSSNIVEYIFPELRESKDEKIRQKFIKLVKMSNEVGGFALHKWEADEMLAWLKKQGEHANFHNKIQIGDKVTRNEAGMLVNISQLNRIAKTRRVKPADKVEPKFHEGEWIVWKDKCYKVNYNGCGYELVDQDGLSTSLEYDTIDENAHIWDVTTDAKAGDVLASELCDSIILFKGIKDYNIDFYCDYDFSKIDIPGDRFSVNNGQHYGNIEDSKDFHPSTKEQRDTLLKAMADAGYTFDFDKKELKKIEKKSQRMVSAEAKEALYNKPTDEEMKELLRTEYEKGRADAIVDMYVPTQISPEESLGVSSEKYMDIVDTLTQGGQKPAKWSLEDERVIAIINNALTESNTPPDDYDKVYDWLESIKQRIGG